MPIKPELKQWMDSLPLSEDVKKLLSPELEKDEVGKKVLETVMLRSDYSRALDQKTQEVESFKQQATREVEAKKAGWDSFKATEEAKAKKFYEDAQAQIRQANADKAAYAQRLSDLVAQGLINAEEAAIAKTEFNQRTDAGTQIQQPVSQPAAKYVAKDEVQQLIGNTHLQNVQASARINDIADAHFDLFGVRLNRQELVEKTLEVNRQRRALGQDEVYVQDVWRSVYGVDAKRQEIEQIQRQKEKEEYAAEQVTRALSERAQAGDSAPYSGLDSNGDKHILSIFSSKDGKSRGMGVSPTVAAAAQAYRDNQRSNKTA